MLVLGRKPGEYVMIGDDIMVKVIEIGNRCHEKYAYYSWRII